MACIIKQIWLYCASGNGCECHPYSSRYGFVILEDIAANLMHKPAEDLEYPNYYDCDCHIYPIPYGNIGCDNLEDMVVNIMHHAYSGCDIFQKYICECNALWAD